MSNKNFKTLSVLFFIVLFYGSANFIYRSCEEKPLVKYRVVKVPDTDLKRQHTLIYVYSDGEVIERIVTKENYDIVSESIIYKGHK